jgi:hypothetical protein
VTWETGVSDMKGLPADFVITCPPRSGESR